MRLVNRQHLLDLEIISVLIAEYIRENKTYCAHPPCSRKQLVGSCSQASQGYHETEQQIDTSDQCAMVRNRDERHCTTMSRQWRSNVVGCELSRSPQQRGLQQLWQSACWGIDGRLAYRDMGRECRRWEE